MMVGTRAKAMHVLGGKTLVEADSDEPAGDPLDDPPPQASSNGDPNSSPKRSQKSSNEPPSAPRSRGRPKKQPRGRPRKHKPPETNKDEISEHETDSDTNHPAEVEERDSDCSGSTGADSEKKNKHLDLTKEYICCHCSKPFFRKDGRSSVKFCSKICTSLSKAGPPGSSRGKRGPYKKRVKQEVTPNDETSSVASTQRSSGRLRKKPARTGVYYGGIDFDSSDEDEATSRQSRKGSVASLRRESFVQPHSPEIESPKASTSRVAIKPRKGPSRDASVASGSGKAVASVKKETVERETSEESKESRHAWQIAKQYLSEKPENVRILVETKPMQNWTFDEAAQVVASIRGFEQETEPSFVMIQQQLDGECLLFFDKDSWKKFGLKMGHIMKIMNEVRKLREIQRKCTLVKWHDDFSAKVEAEMARLDKLSVA